MSNRCDRCGESLQHPLRCDACDAVQVPDPGLDHFSVLGVPRRFDLDSEKLAANHLRLSRDLHPDRAGLDTNQKPRAVLASAQLNEAFKALSEPARRAEYLLALHGGKTSAEDKSVPDGFLEEMFEVRSALEECLNQPDGEQARGLEADLKARRDQQLERVRSLFAELPEPGDAEIGGDELNQIRRALNIAAYFGGFLRDLRNARR